MKFGMYQNSIAPEFKDLHCINFKIRKSMIATEIQLKRANNDIQKWFIEFQLTDEEYCSYRKLKVWHIFDQKIDTRTHLRKRWLAAIECVSFIISVLLEILHFNVDPCAKSLCQVDNLLSARKQTWIGDIDFLEIAWVLFGCLLKLSLYTARQSQANTIRFVHFSLFLFVFVLFSLFFFPFQIQ